MMAGPLDTGEARGPLDKIWRDGQPILPAL
jgi:hypothetical protein